MVSKINGAVSFGLLVLILTLCHMPLALAQTVGPTTECHLGIDHAGGVIQLDARRQVLVEVVGSAITYGASGPTVPVFVELGTVSAGSISYEPLFGGAAVDGGEIHIGETGELGAEYSIRGTADYDPGSFFMQFDSVNHPSNVLTLMNGDAIPHYAPFDGQATIETFLAGLIVQGTNGPIIAIEDNQVILLFEFAVDVQQNPNSTAIDFQDLVVLVTSNSLNPFDRCNPRQGFECEAGDARACDSQCGSGRELCENGFWQACDAPQPCDEVCDGIDNDCDGETDEALLQVCFDGFAALEGVGMCHAGTQACEGGAWGACEDQCLPDDEECDGVDNDCDGDTDEGCDCLPGQTRACGSPVGACQEGIETCVRGKWSACQGATGPSAEECDGIDNDCDGTNNEDIAPYVHYTGPDGTMGVGICRPGVEMCKTSVTPATVMVEWSICVDEVVPEDEFCDGLDNDCDGTTDEGCECINGEMRLCGESAGACQEGIQGCGDGRWGDCQDAVAPAVEVCDGTIDENCDGQVDEGCECVNGEIRACGSPVGACEEGQQSCDGGTWGECTGAITAVTETCDGADNNCDGATDEGCDCTTDGQTQDCGSATGACSPGTQDCSNGQWSECVGQVEAIAEACDDGSDNDCDGETDEDCDYDPAPETSPDTDTDTETATDSDTDPNNPANINDGSVLDDPNADAAQADVQTDANGDGGKLFFESGGLRSCQFSPARTATGASLWWLAVPLLAPAVWWRRRLQKSRPC